MEIFITIVVYAVAIFIIGLFFRQKIKAFLFLKDRKNNFDDYSLGIIDAKGNYYGCEFGEHSKTLSNLSNLWGNSVIYIGHWHGKIEVSILNSITKAAKDTLESNWDDYVIDFDDDEQEQEYKDIS